MIWSTRVLKPLPTTRVRALLSSRPWRETVRLGCLWPGGKTENELSTTQWDTYCQRELPGSRSGSAQGQRWDEWLTPTVMAAHTLHKCAQRDHSARLHRQAPNRAQTAYKLWGYTPPIGKRAAWNEGRCELTGTHRELGVGGCLAGPGVRDGVGRRGQEMAKCFTHDGIHRWSSFYPYFL